MLPPTGTNLLYIKRVKGFHPMQVTNSATIVDYVVKATDAKYDWSARINNGSTVTGFNTDKMPRSEYMPLMC
jgi:hypothetical protein